MDSGGRGHVLREVRFAGVSRDVRGFDIRGDVSRCGPSSGIGYVMRSGRIQMG